MTRLNQYFLPPRFSKKKWSTRSDLDFAGDPRSYVGLICFRHTPDWVIEGKKMKARLSAHMDKMGYYGVKVTASVDSDQYACRRDKMTAWVLDHCCEVKAVYFLLLAQQQAKIMRAYKDQSALLCMDVSPELDAVKRHLLPSSKRGIKQGLERLLKRPLPYYLTTRHVPLLAVLDANQEVVLCDEADDPDEPQVFGARVTWDEGGNTSFIDPQDDIEAKIRAKGLDPLDVGDEEDIIEIEKDEAEEKADALRYSPTLSRSLSSRAVKKLRKGLEGVVKVGQFISVFQPIQHSIEDLELSDELSEDQEIPQAPLVDKRTVADMAATRKAITYAKTKRLEAHWAVIAMVLEDSEKFVTVTRVDEKGGFSELVRIMRNLNDVYIKPELVLDEHAKRLHNSYDLNFEKFSPYAGNIDRAYGWGPSYKPP